MYPYVTYVAYSIIGSAGIFEKNIIYMGFSWFFVERQPRSVPTVTSNCCCLNVAFSRSNSCWISELVKYGTWNWSESLYHG